VTSITNLRKKLREEEHILLDLRTRLRQGETMVSLNMRGGKQSQELPQQNTEIANKIIDKRKTIEEIKRQLACDTALLLSGPDPAKEIEKLSTASPILLLPVRIQTRFRKEPPQLWVRIYPDDIAVETHEPLLTEAEYTAGCQYFRDLSAAEQGTNAEELRGLVWKALVEKFGAQRAVWIRNRFLVIDPKYLRNWDATTNPPAELDFVPLGDVVLRPESWSQPPRSYVMPDRFAVRLYRNGTKKYEKWGNPIPYPLIVGPDPFPPEESDPGLLSEEASWMVDFEKAVTVGMGVKIDLVHDEDLTNGFTRVLVIGVRVSADAESGSSHLEELVYGHHYTDGFSLLSQGTATNNTLDAQTDFSSREADYKTSYEIEIGRPLGDMRSNNDSSSSDGESADGAALTRALGIKRECLDHIQNAQASAGENARKMQTALWSATWDNFLRGMMADCFDDNAITVIKNHYTKYVRARGPYSAIRVGDMPYGILPTAAFSAWKFTGEEGDDSVIEQLYNVLRGLYPIWAKIAQDAEAIPRVGGSNDPEKELVRILGMDGKSSSCQVRPVVEGFYLWNLLSYLRDRIAGGILPSQFDVAPRMIDSKQWLLEWWKILKKGKEEAVQLLRNLGCEKHLPILDVIPWGRGYTLSEDDVVSWLLAAPEFNSAKELSEEDVLHLQELDLDERRQLVMECLDLATHRLDAWFTSLATRRLDSMRKTKQGIYLGAFGWLEDLKPAEESQTSGGFIHGPSLSHAAAAAVLRSAYLNHANKDKAQLMAVDLSSQRVRRALWILDAVREGQPLGAILGHQFERDLHENYVQTSLELDQFIAPFRKLYPLKAGRDAESQTEPVEAIAARNVVDGLSLLEAYQKGQIPFGQGELPALGTSEHEAVSRELGALDETLDAIGDLALSESVYQSVQGNYDRAGALLEAISGSARPPEPEVIRTPRSGFSLKHRFMMIFDVPEGGPSLDNGVWPKTLRSELEPTLAKWAGGMLGDPSHIKCRVSWDGRHEGPYFIALADLNTAPDKDPAPKVTGIGPLDFLNLSISSATNEASELERRIAYYVRRKHNLSYDTKISIEFNRKDDWTPWDNKKDRTFPEILELSRRMATFLGQARFLTPSDFCVPEEASGLQESDIVPGDVEALQDRIDSIKTRDPSSTEIGTSFDGAQDIINAQLNKRAHERSYDVIRQGLFALSQFDIQGAVPESAVEKFTPLFSVDSPNSDFKQDLNNRIIPHSILERFGNSGIELSDDLDIKMRRLSPPGESWGRWSIIDRKNNRTWGIVIERSDPNGTNISDKAHIFEGSKYLIYESFMAQIDSVMQQVQKKDTEYKTLLECQGAKIQDVVDGARVLFGRSFTLLPRYRPPSRAELASALELKNTEKLLDGESPHWPLLWLHQCAHTHPRVRQFETMMTFGQALSYATLDLRIGQLPYSESGDRWLALPFKQDGPQSPPQGKVSMIAYTPEEFQANAFVAGLMIEEWDEMIPAREETTAIAYQFNQPNSEPPQVLLLAVPPAMGEQDAVWNWEHLVSTVSESLDMAKVRAVDLDALKGVGQLLPAIFFPVQLTVGSSPVTPIGPK